MKIYVWRHSPTKCPNSGRTLPSLLRSFRNVSWAPSETQQGTLVFWIQNSFQQIPQSEWAGPAFGGDVPSTLPPTKQFSQISGIHFFGVSRLFSPLLAKMEHSLLGLSQPRLLWRPLFRRGVYFHMLFCDIKSNVACGTLGSYPSATTPKKA